MARRRGRPSLVEDGQTISTRLGGSDYDAVCQIALSRDVSVSRVVRLAVLKLIRDEKSAIFILNNRPS
jgi:hypothetical protein